jgi:rare lipoprotein A
VNEPTPPAFVTEADNFVPEPTPKPVVPAAPVQPVRAQSSAPPARILGGAPQAASTKLYRMQVGAYKVPKNAVDVHTKLKNAGLSPDYEKSGDLYRVVLAKVKAAEVQSVAQTLGNLGFTEVIIREESR